MPRLVVAKPAAQADVAAENNIAGKPADGYSSRLVKYVPAESVAFYTFVVKLLTTYYGLHPTTGATKIPADWALNFLPCLFIALGVIFTPFYFYKQKLTGQPWGLHAAIATIAFVFWAYSL